MVIWMITALIVVFSDNPVERNRKEKNWILVVSASPLGGFFQHSREADGVSLSSAFWELPPKLRASLSHTLTDWFGFHSSPQKYIVGKSVILVQESYKEASFKGCNVLM